eukprot:13312597-Ditylum_brightwellii.AAC.1
MAPSEQAQQLSAVILDEFALGLVLYVLLAPSEVVQQGVQVVGPLMVAGERSSAASVGYFDLLLLLAHETPFSFLIPLPDWQRLVRWHPLSYQLECCFGK